jgi:hypothetical protein
MKSSLRPIALLLVISSLCVAGPAKPLTATPLATLSFGEPVPLVVDGEPMAVTGHAATRVVDWNDDGQLDLVVGGGDGRVWLYENLGENLAGGNLGGDNSAGITGPRFAKARPVVAGGRDRWGTSLTGALLANLIGDSKPDLVVGHSNNQVSIHENVGSFREPAFAEAANDVVVQDGCHGRIDVGDWNGDGRLDLVTGSFGGAILWHRNDGQPQAVSFAVSQPLQDVTIAYNSHPRLLDMDRNGTLDLLVGVNWGSVSVFFNEGTPAKPRLAASRQLGRASDGLHIGLREMQGDDTTPELADLNGDGVFDLISGGSKGRVVMLAGVGPSEQIAVLQNALAQHGDALGEVLGEDEPLRKRLFGSLQAIQADLTAGVFCDASRADLARSLASLAGKYPGVFGRRRFDIEAAAYAGQLAAQAWTVLLEAVPDTRASREQVADTFGFEGAARRLLVDLGVIFIDNNTATPEQLDAMHQLMMALPRSAWDVKTITVADWLGPAVRTQPIRSSAGVNIFGMALGQTENSFPVDSPRGGVTDVFLICLAHELAHNMLDTVGRRTRPDLFERKYAILERAAGPLVAYRSPKSLGIDLKATQERFRKAGVWDGAEASWSDAWKSHFDGVQEFDRATCRGNVRFFLESPQEAFATLANQYVADSGLMLEFCKARWDSGQRANADQFVLIAEVLSGGRDQVEFYVLRPGGRLVVTTARLERDDRGRIALIEADDRTATFAYGDNDLVERFGLDRHGGDAEAADDEE